MTGRRGLPARKHVRHRTAGRGRGARGPEQPRILQVGRLLDGGIAQVPTPGARERRLDHPSREGSVISRASGQSPELRTPLMQGTSVRVLTTPSALCRRTLSAPCLSPSCSHSAAISEPPCAGSPVKFWARTTPPLAASAVELQIAQSPNETAVHDKPSAILSACRHWRAWPQYGLVLPAPTATIVTPIAISIMKLRLNATPAVKLGCEQVERPSLQSLDAKVDVGRRYYAVPDTDPSTGPSRREPHGLRQARRQRAASAPATSSRRPRAGPSPRQSVASPWA